MKVIFLVITLLMVISSSGESSLDCEVTAIHNVQSIQFDKITNDDLTTECIQAIPVYRAGETLEEFEFRTSFC